MNNDYSKYGSTRTGLTGLGFRRILLGSASAALLLMATNSGALAAPSMNTVEAGQATVSTYGNLTTITQTTDRAVLNWNSFNLTANETANFVVPSASGATMNRITGGYSTKIDGTVTSNGDVYFVNPNGLVFNASSRVTANGFYAYTGTVNTSDFMAGRNLAMATPTLSTAPTIQLAGPIGLNLGSSGKVGVYGPEVAVTGTITSNGRSVEIVSYNRNMTIAAVTTNGGNLSLTSGGNISLNGVINLGSGDLALVSTALSTRVSATADRYGIGTITNTSDIIADRVTVTSSGQGNVILTNIHIAKLGEVMMINELGDKIFSLTNRRDLTVDGAVRINGSLALKTIDSSAHGIDITKDITVNQLRSGNTLVSTSANFGISLTLNSAGGIRASGAISVSGDASVTAIDNIELNGNLVADRQLSNGNAVRGILKVTSNYGSILSSADIVGMRSLTITAATGIVVNNLGSGGDLNLSKSCSAEGCLVQAGDIIVNGWVTDYSVDQRTDPAKIKNLTITNNYGNILINRSIEVENNITISATNGSVIQADSDRYDYVIRARNGKISIKSITSNDPVGIRVNYLESKTKYLNDSGIVTVSAIRDAIVLESDTDIMVDVRWIDAKRLQKPSLFSDFGNIRLTSTNGSITTSGDIVLKNRGFGYFSDIALTASNGSITLDGEISGSIDFDNLFGKLLTNRNIAGATVHLTAGIDGIAIKDYITAVGSITIRADQGGDVSLAGRITARSFELFDNVTTEHRIYSNLTAPDSRGNVIIVGRNLTTDGVMIEADHQISVSMTGNISMEGNSFLTTEAAESDSGSVFTDQSVKVITTGSNKRLTMGSNSGISGDSILLQGGIVTLSGEFLTQGTTDALGSITVNSTSGNLTFNDARVNSAQSIVLNAGGSIVANHSSFTASGVKGGFTIGNYGTNISGSVLMDSSSVVAKVLQIDAHGTVQMYNFENRIDKLAYINSFGGDISLATTGDLLIVGGTALNTSNLVRSISLDVNGNINLLGNVILKGGVVAVSASQAVRTAAGTPAGSNFGFYYYNKNNNFSYNGSLRSVTTSSIPVAVRVPTN